MKYIFIICILVIGSYAKDEGSALYHSCKFCHGYKGERVYMDLVPNLKDMSASEIEAKLILYKKGELDSFGYGSMMKMQMKNIPVDKISELSSYIEKL